MKATCFVAICLSKNQWDLKSQTDRFYQAKNRVWRYKYLWTFIMKFTMTYIILYYPVFFFFFKKQYQTRN